MVKLTPEAIAERATWQYKIVAFTKGNQSQIGALAVAMLGRRVNPPCFHPSGLIIKPTGQVTALYKRAITDRWQVQTIYETVAELSDVFRGLAKFCELDEAQTLSMFAELRKFVAKDLRKEGEHGRPSNDTQPIETIPIPKDQGEPIL